jgi:hypothetical protein
MKVVFELLNLNERETMRNITIITILIILFIAGSCGPKEKPPVEGTWKLVYGKWIGHNETFPDQVEGGSIKFWSKDHFAFAGQLVLDTLVINSLGGGTYKLVGDRYEEQVLYSSVETSIGVMHRIFLEIRNDTLTQKWPADGNWELPEEYNFEKYVRVK